MDFFFGYWWGVAAVFFLNRYGKLDMPVKIVKRVSKHEKH